jgi:hypothetical protein
MEWTTKARGNALVVRPTGAIDHDSAEAFQENLTAALEQLTETDGPLVIDFSGGLLHVQRRAACVDARFQDREDKVRSVGGR